MKKENINKIVNALVDCGVYGFEDAEIYTRECLVKPLDSYCEQQRFRKRLTSEIIRERESLVDQIETQGEDILSQIINAYKVDRERTITKL